MDTFFIDVKSYVNPLGDNRGAPDLPRILAILPTLAAKAFTINDKL